MSKSIGIIKNDEMVATVDLVKPENGHSRLESNGLHVKLDVKNVSNGITTISDTNGENIATFRNVGDENKPKFQATVGNVTVSVTSRFTTWTEGDVSNVITF